MPDNADQPITRAEFKADLTTALENFAEAIIDNISDLRTEMNHRFDRVDKRLKPLNSGSSA